MRPREHDPAADRRVMVVDDEASIRDPLGRFLSSRGYEVHSADSVASALALLDRLQFGALLCDVRMPGRSGLELLPETRSRDEDCAVVMLTGVNDAATATEALAQGAVDYLTKPVELDRLAIAIELIEIAGMVHDIGKIAIPDALLMKLEPLSADEWLTVREHVRIGVDLLRPLRHLSPMLPFVRDHHECWDGSGYPEGRRGEEISIGGRILMVANAYTASVAGRPYDDALTPAQALARVEQYAGTRFDPVVVRALRAVVERDAT